MAQKNSLYKQHAAAHAAGQRALDVFRKLAGELRQSAEQHRAVAVQAHDEALTLADLRDSASEAATNAERQAETIEALVQ